ncbi:hypothetical protein N0O92_04645 [Alkalihalobacillus sp. MEB130]|uniref:hypothetical protein n=1 Tax=Alkalihalobacillus sp. MEB130 TaxID=2976704 RepID=UPI0028DE15A9|nr:hypothetical protein [Alkalihalobacillus sp. MEB130]MDT8859512.1 hypothetical protein [Alkalihalobacillus sp. MEB130]
MNMKTLLSSQYGGALVTVLVVIVLFSIAAPMLVKVTVHSKNSIETNVETQEEFYRAEGALRLVLHEMESYRGNHVDLLDGNGNVVKDGAGNEIQIQQVGPYFYLQDGVIPSSKVIGERTVKVDITKIEIDSETYKATLKANYADGPSIVARELTVTVKKEQRPIIEQSGQFLSGPIRYTSSFEYGQNSRHTHDELNVFENNKVLSTIKLDEILQYLNYTPTNAWNYNQNLKISSSHTFSQGRHYPISIGGTGNSTGTVRVPSNSIVFAKKVEYGGVGNNEDTLIIDGILIAEDFSLAGNPRVEVNGALIVLDQFSRTGGGNNDFVVNSGMIAKKFQTTGNQRYSGEAKGISCSLIGLLQCDGPTTVDYFDAAAHPWSSSFGNIDYQTVRQ